MARGMARVLEWLILVYFATHIPITIFFDSQAIMPAWLYPQILQDLVRDYSVAMKDEMMADPSVYPWFLAFVYGECLLQFPFFFVAVYAFYKGSCKWIRIPAIMYAVHTATTLQAILAHILFQDFSNALHPGPSTFKERVVLFSIYFPYFILPILIILLMLFCRDYQPGVPVPKAAGSTSKKQKTR